MTKAAFNKIETGLKEALAYASAESPVNTCGLTRNELVAHLRVSPETVDGWLSGAKRRPPYFDAAVRAARAGLHPIAKPLVHGHHAALGVEPSRVKYWLDTGQVPVPARMAVSWIIHKRVTGRD